MKDRKEGAGGLRVLPAVLFVALAVTSLAPGCDGDTGTEGSAQRGTRGSDQTSSVSQVTSDWVSAAHSNIRVEPAEESPCVSCHDGGGFSRNTTDPATLEREFPVAIDCRACHTGQGLEAISSGSAMVESTSSPVSGGTGAVCMSCHNARRMPNIDQPERRAPHYSAQTDVLRAFGGIRAPGFAPLGSTQRHANVQNACVSCHMTEKNGAPSHTFRAEDLRAACRCHEGLTQSDRPARADYDGDGTTEGFQTEVEGLLSAIESATLDAMPGATEVTEAQGRILFKAGEETMTAQIPAKAYVGAYNHALIEHDGSRGIHNPRFVVDLLQQTYRYLTGVTLGAPAGGAGGGGMGGTRTTGTPGGGGTGGTGTTGTPGTP